MYAQEWAKARVHEHMCSHTRATELLRDYLNVSPGELTFWLMSGDNLWELWKYLVRNLENGLGIRANPNTTKHLDSEQAFSICYILTHPGSEKVSTSILTALPKLMTLKEHCIERRGVPRQPLAFHFQADDGQILLEFDPV